MLIVLWLTRRLGKYGWENFFIKGYTSDTTPAIIILFLCVLWPQENIFKGKPYSNLLSFSQIKEHLPWNVILFAGGCLSLSEGFQLSGLSDKIGNIFNQIAPKDQFQALVLVICFASIVTEVNTYFNF